MSDVVEGQEPAENAEVVETDAAPEGNSPQQVETPQSNPFWKEVEDKLGPNNYQVIQPYLAQADTKHREGIEALNSRFKPYQPFIDQGITPDVIQASIGLVRTLNETPEVIYEKLHEFLEREGRLPNKQELQDEVENGQDEDEDPRDAQLRQLQERQQQFEQFFEQQAQAQVQQQMDQEADSWLEGEINNLKTAHADYAEEDLKEVIRIAVAQTREGQAPDIAKAAEHFESLRNRFRNAPRAADSAPRIPGGVGGGTPTGGAPSNAPKTAEQRQALVASMLASRNQ